MLSPEQLETLAQDLESFQVERKGSFKPVKSAIEEAICAFANDLPGTGLPGVVLIGADDKTGAPTGLKVTDELLREITDIRSAGNILPPPVMTISKATLQGQDVVVVEVSPSQDPPVRLRGRVCVRVGPRKGTATREEERILSERRRAGDQPFDHRRVPGAMLEHVDLERLRQEYLPLAVDPRPWRRTSDRWSINWSRST
jgi:ATP-dependent DNA helicase RecG